MKLPDRLLLRRGDLIEAGISKHEVDKLIDCEILHPIHLRKNSRAYFKRDEVESVLNGWNGGDK